MKEKTFWGYSIMRNNRLQAVHDDDLSNLLMSLGVYESVQNGECSCLFCQKVIAFDNLGAIVPMNGEISFVCDSARCLNAMTGAGGTNDNK